MAVKDSRRTIPKEELPTGKVHSREEQLTLLIFGSVLVVSLVVSIYLTYLLNIGMVMVPLVLIPVLIVFDVLVNIILVLQKLVRPSETTPSEEPQVFSGKALGFRSWRIGSDENGELILSPHSAAS